MSDKITGALSGNFGEHYVASQLAGAGCLVRPVANQADTGIDLYCETSVPSGKANTPFVHFGVQVKTNTRFERANQGFLCTLSVDQSVESPVVIKSDESPVTIKISCRDLLYWERQPIPVFVACVVLNAWPPTKTPSLQIISITDVMLGEHPPLEIDKELNRGDPAATPNAEVSFACSLELPPFDQGALRAFLDWVVPTRVAALQVRRGVVENVPTLPDADTRAPKSKIPTHRFVPQILDQIRRTATQAILSAFRHDVLPQFMSAKHSSLIKSVVETFANAETLQHWEDWLALALWQSTEPTEASYAQAMTSFVSAARVIRDDWANLERNSRDWIAEQKEWQQILNWLDKVAKTGRVKTSSVFTPLRSLRVSGPPEPSINALRCWLLDDLTEDCA